MPAIVGSRAIDAQPDGNAGLYHFRNAGDAAGQAHVAGRAVSHAGSGFAEDAVAALGETHHVDAGYHVVGMKAVDAPDMSKE